MKHEEKNEKKKSIKRNKTDPQSKLKAYEKKNVQKFLHFKTKR